MDVLKELEKFAKDLFSVDIETFIAAIRLSPNAQGYLSGAITEIKLKRYLESKGFEVLRVKEKWEGNKHPNHHGDFYIRKNKGDWFVLESKGVKSNSEKWHRLYNKNSLIEFLFKNIDKTPFKSKEEIEGYVTKELPLFKTRFKNNLYTLNELQKYKPSKKKTQKAQDILMLKKLKPEDVERMVVERLDYVMSKIKLIETHLVSGGSKKSKRTQATPRVDEFNLLSLDLVLRTGEHEFIFVNPALLEPSSADRNHLQQNYIVGVIVEGLNDTLILQEPWGHNFDKIFLTLKNPIKEKDMQIDHRADVIEEETLEKLK